MRALGASKNGENVQNALKNLLNVGGNGSSNINEQSPTPSILTAQTRAAPSAPKGKKEMGIERKKR